MKRTEDYKRLLNSSRWRKLRTLYLARHPLCELCAREEIVREAAEVHHITEIERGRTPEEMERLAYDPYNLMALCHSCHREVHRRAGKSTAQQQKERTRMEVDAFLKRFIGEPGG